MADRVYFSVVVPPNVIPQLNFVVELWAHLEGQQKEIIKRVRETDNNKRILIGPFGPADVIRGTNLSAKIQLEELTLESPIKTILWNGDKANANFIVKAPDHVMPGFKNGSIKLYVKGCLIRTIDLVIEVSVGADGRKDSPRPLMDGGTSCDGGSLLDGGKSLDGGKRWDKDVLRIRQYEVLRKILKDRGFSEEQLENFRMYLLDRDRREETRKRQYSLDGGASTYPKAGRKKYSRVTSRWEATFDNIKAKREEKRKQKTKMKKQRKKEKELKKTKRIELKKERKAAKTREREPRKKPRLEKGDKEASKRDREDAKKYSRIEEETKRIERRWGRYIGSRKKDRVHFTVTAPPTVKPQLTFLIFLWAHLDQQREEVIKRAKEMMKKKKILGISVGPKYVARGTTIIAEIQINELIIKDSIKSILWDGETANTNFLVKVPKDAYPGRKGGSIKIYVEGCLLQKIEFTIEVSDHSKEVEPMPITIKQYNKAFCCYASADRDLVVHRIQGMKKVAPDMDIFVDVLSLRSGENWEEKLWEVIPKRDIFYLFWSENARKSKWVEKEWRCALETKGLNFIDPVPLSREIVPPPPELEAKHFYNGILRFMD